MEDFFAPLHLLILLVAFLLYIVPLWQIFKKAGFVPALSLFVWIPVAGLIVLYYVGFSYWKPASGNNITPV